MTFRSTFVAATALLSAVNAHIIMKDPVPYGKDTIDNSPITADQFPCKSNNGFKVSEVTKLSPGQSHPLTFTGSAVHNGGLCQLSVALTREPTKDTEFKVIKTIEGGCPGLDAKVNEFSFELPDSIPDGEHTFAWTWMPTSSGGPEFYMNCAPIEVSGGASDESKFGELPDMLVANLPGLTTCTQTVNTILEAPNPGDVVEFLDDSHPLAPPTGDCGGSGKAPVERRSSSSISSQPTAVPSNPGGVFAPGASSVSNIPTSTSTTTITVTSAPYPTASGSGSPAEPTAPAATTAPAAAPTGTAPAAPAQGNTCSENGAVVCNGPTHFGLCDNGKVVWQQVAAGTTCNNGQITKRGVPVTGRYARAALVNDV